MGKSGETRAIAALAIRGPKRGIQGQDVLRKITKGAENVIAEKALTRGSATADFVESCDSPRGIRG